MKHGKRLLSLFLAVIMVVAVAFPSLPGVGVLVDEIGAAVTANAADPVPLNKKADDFDLETEIRNAKHVEDISATAADLHNWKFVDNYDSLKTELQKDETSYIRLSKDIYRKFESNDQSREPDGVGKIYNHCILIKNNKVLDLNGHKLEVEDYKNDHQSALFYVIKPDTTVILLDSSAEQTGKIWYHSDIVGASFVFRHASVEDLFQVHDATVYVLGGIYQAGKTQQQDVYTGWEKFVGIASAVVKSAISIGSQALDVYTTITSGGTLGSSGILSGIKDAFSMDSTNVSGVLSNMVSKVSGNKDGGKTGAQAPTITNPLAGGANVEPEVDDLNGRTANTSAGLSSAAAAAETSLGTADTAAQGGTGPSIAMDSLGIYVKTTTGNTYVYSKMIESTANRINGDNPLKKGDEIDVLKEKENEGVKWYLIKYKDQEAYVKPDGFKTVATAGQISSTGNILENGLKASVQTFKKETEKGGEGQSSWSGIIEAGTEGMDMVKKSAKVLENAVMGVVNAVKTYTAKWYQVHWGTCFDLRGDAQLVILDGKFAGYGQGVKEREDKVVDGKTLSWVKGECDIRDEVIDCSLGGEVWIMGGEFYGMCGANIFNAGPLNLPANRTKIHVRGGYFNCTSVNRIRGLEPKDKDKSVCIAGTKGQVNLPVEAYGKDLIRDGRIQLIESTGVGNLVVKNRSINQNEITYSLYCAEEDLPHLNELKVAPGQSQYMANTFKLIGNASQDHVLDGSHFINFTIGDMTAEHAYVAPLVNSKNLRQVLGTSATESELEDAIYDSEAWYYKYPKNSFLRNLRMDDRQIIDGVLKAGKKYDYISDLRIYTYTLHELDPVTQEEIGAPLAVKTVPSSKIFTGQLYLIPHTTSNGNDYYLYDGWKPGGMYKVTMAVDEILDIGSPDKSKRDAFGESKRVATIGTTSLLIRCWDAADEEYTPIRFTSENLGQKDTAEVTFLNARVGRVDIYGQKLFTVQYNWRIAGTNNGKAFDVPLLTATRKQQGITTPFTIEGHIYDDWEYQHKYHPDFLTEFTDRGVANSIKPYWGGSDQVKIPSYVTVNGSSVSTAGKQIYCKVTYGLCYYRWAKAIKTLPIIEFPPVADATHAADNAASDVRQTVQQCTYETKRVTIKSNRQDALIWAARGNTPATDVYVPEGSNYLITGSECKLYASSVIPLMEDALYRWNYEANGKVPSEAEEKQLKTDSVLAENSTSADSLFWTLDEYNPETHVGGDINATQARRNAVNASKNNKYSCSIGVHREWQQKLDNENDFYRPNNAYYLKQNSVNFINIKEGITLRCKVWLKIEVFYNGEKYVEPGHDYVYQENLDLYMEPYHLIPVTPQYYFGMENVFDDRMTDYGNLERDGWHWDKTTNTLTLKNYKGSITPNRSSGTNASKNANMFRYIQLPNDATVRLLGENEITFLSRYYTNADWGIDEERLLNADSLRFVGDGNLTMKLKHTSQRAFDARSSMRCIYANRIVFDHTGKITFALDNDWPLAEAVAKYESGILGSYTAISTYGYIVMLSCKNATTDAGAYLNSGEIAYTVKTPLFDPSDNGPWTSTDPNGEEHTFSNKYGIIKIDGMRPMILMQFPASGGTPELRVGASEASAKLVPMSGTDIATYIKDGTRGEWYASLKLNNHRHTWGDTVVIKSATATEGGKVRMTCEGCGETTEMDTSPFAITSKNVFIDPEQDNAGKLLNSRIVLSNHPEAEKYEVYRKNRETGEWELLGSESGTDFYDYDVQYQRKYDYKFRMIRSNGEPKVAEFESIGWWMLRPVDPGSAVYCDITVENGYPDIDLAYLTDTVTITARPAPAGKTFDKWEIVSGHEIKIADPANPVTTFTIGTSYTQDVKIKATYKDLPPVQHSVTVVNGTASAAAAAKGTTIIITASAAPEGKAFDKWEVVKGGITLADASAATTTFVMGDADVEVKAMYKDLPASQHSITVTGGTASVSAAAKGATVTITANAAPEGKVFDKWEVVKGGITLASATAASTTFVMGDADVEVKATYKDLPASQHSITVTGGTAGVSAAAKGATVTITANAAPAGKVFDKWEVVKGGITLANATAAATTFTMGDADVEVKATYKDVGGTEGYLLGDVDNNGIVSSADARLALRRSVNLETYAEGSPEFIACDVDMDGRVTSADARLILRRSVNFVDPEWGVKAN